VVGEVGAGQPPRRAGRVPLGHVLGALPAERRERDDARIEPDVADLGDPLDLLPARLATDPDLVDPGATKLLEPLDRHGRVLQELCLRADHVQRAAGAGVEGQREAVVAAARDVPVAHVEEPVVHALAHVRRRPFDGVVRVE
jgi:hypothetical protein